MSVTLQQLLSRVQIDFDDIAFNKIQRAEYLDIAKEVADSISRKGRVWVQEILVTPMPSLDYTYDTDADRLAASGFVPADIGKSAYVIETGLYWRLTSDSPITWLEFKITEATLPAASNVIKLIAVSRNGAQAREYSWQSVLSWNESGWAFAHNDTVFSSGTFNAMKLPDESMVLRFAAPFQVGESVKVVAYAAHPWPMAVWNESTSIPDFLYDVMKDGITLAIAKRLFMKGNDAIASRLQLAQSDYNKSYSKAIAYTRNLLDQRSFNQVQPLNWLPE